MNIVLIGAGAIGKRHLQSLCDVQFDAKIFVVDPSQAAIDETKKFIAPYEEKSPVEIFFVSDVSEIPDKKADLAIVATNSIERRAVLSQLIKEMDCSNIILEKFLFPALADYDSVHKLIVSKKLNVWVNCPMRTMHSFLKIKNMLHGPVNLFVNGGNWRMASNAIHYLDLHAFLNNDQYQYKTTLLLLDKNKIPAKRNGYFEFNGLMRFDLKDAYIIFNSDSQINAPSTLSIQNDAVQFFITDKQALCAQRENGWQWKPFEFEWEFQSKLTANLATAINNRAPIGLINYHQSEKLHKLLLRAFLTHPSVKEKHEAVYIT